MLSEEFRRDSKNEFELAIVNDPSVFEPSRFDCIVITLWDGEGAGCFVFLFLPLGVIGRLCSGIVALPGQLIYYSA